MPLEGMNHMMRNGSRYARLTGTSMLAVAMTAGLAVSAARVLSSSPAAAATTSAHRAPRHFNPLNAYLSFGWLPKGVKLTGGDVLPQDVALLAAHKASDLAKWDMQAIAAGQCHVRAHTLTCPSPVLIAPHGLKLTTRAPSVQGHRAYWAEGMLVWRWARNAWATLRTPSERPGPRTKADAVRIARHVAYGAPVRPLEFSVQLSRLPSKWHVGSVFWQVEAGRARATRFSLLTHPTQNADGGMEFQRKLPWFEVQGADTHSKFKICGLPPNRTINGHRVHVSKSIKPAYQSLCTDQAHGLAFDINLAGLHPRLSVTTILRSHLRLLGNNPENWTTKPVR